jgi:hypothetical protein
LSIEIEFVAARANAEDSGVSGLNYEWRLAHLFHGDAVVSLASFADRDWIISGRRAVMLRDELWDRDADSSLQSLLDVLERVIEGDGELRVTI